MAERHREPPPGTGGAVGLIPEVATGFSEATMASRTGQSALKKLVSVSGCRPNLTVAAGVPISAQGPARNVR